MGYRMAHCGSEEVQEVPLSTSDSSHELQGPSIGNGELTAAILPEAEIAPTVRLDCRRAFLSNMTLAREVKERLFEQN